MQGQVESAEDSRFGANTDTPENQTVSAPAVWEQRTVSAQPIDIVKYLATPLSDNPARPLQTSNPKGLQDELIRHLKEDGRMSGFDFAVQFLDTDTMTYWRKRQDANFWIENASVEWNESDAPFHTVARLTLLRDSHLQPDVGEATYFDVTGNSTPDSRPIGSINRARWPSEVASRKARAHASSSRERSQSLSCSR
jgi:hypothetical protein